MFDVCNCDECRKAREGRGGQLLSTVVVWGFIIMAVVAFVYAVLN